MSENYRVIIVSVVLGVTILFGSMPMGADNRNLFPDSIAITLISASPRTTPVFKTVDSILTEMKIPKHYYTYLSTVYNVDIPSRFLPDELIAIFIYYSLLAPPTYLDKTIYDYITKYKGRRYIVEKGKGDFLVDNFGRKIHLTVLERDANYFIIRLLYPIVLVVKTNGDIVVLTNEDEDYYRFVE